MKLRGNRTETIPATASTQATLEVARQQRRRRESKNPGNRVRWHDVQVVNRHYYAVDGFLVRASAKCNLLRTRIPPVQHATWARKVEEGPPRFPLAATSLPPIPPMSVLINRFEKHLVSSHGLDSTIYIFRCCCRRVAPLSRSIPPTFFFHDLRGRVERRREAVLS